MAQLSTAMQFEFDGETYRIAFRHPVPSGLAYHAGHAVALIRDTNQKTRRPQGPTRLICEECEVRFGRPVRISLRRKDEVRSIVCVIYVCRSRENSKPEWEAVGGGESRLNRKAKDRYTREGGRQAALNAALLRDFNAEFRTAARAAYANRKADGAAL
jgi:hypothetical protein